MEREGESHWVDSALEAKKKAMGDAVKTLFEHPVDTINQAKASKKLFNTLLTGFSTVSFIFGSA